jgi:hypothetical protein
MRPCLHACSAPGCRHPLTAGWLLLRPCFKLAFEASPFLQYAQVNPEAAVEIQIADDNRQALFDFARCHFRANCSACGVSYMHRDTAVLRLENVLGPCTQTCQDLH